MRSVIEIVLLALLLPGILAQAPPQDCDLVDVGLILDSSRNVGRDAFVQAQMFIQNLLGRLNVGINNTRVAAIRYTHNIFPMWNFLDSESREDMIYILDRVRYGRGGRQRLAKAIRYTDDNLFTSAMGDRREVPDAVVIFTDGRATDNPHLRVRRLKRRRMRVLVVAIGKIKNIVQLGRIATSPSDVFTLDQLDEVVRQIKGAARMQCPALPATNATTVKCPDTMVYSLCATCVPTCDQINRPPKCTKECRHQCTCLPDKYLHQGRCITAAECPPPSAMSASGESRLISTPSSMECPYNMIWSSCAGCTPTCAQKDEPLPCLLICLPGCTCPRNTYIHNGFCVTEDRCPETCPGNMIYEEDCVGCTPTCREVRQLVPCVAKCKPGCTCPNNTYLHEGSCVTADVCPVPECPGNMVYSTCAGCDVPCEMRSTPFPCAAVCRQKCTCPRNTFLYEGRCVTEDQCPPECPANFIYSKCASCPLLCYQRNQPVRCSRECRIGCYCRPGLYLHHGQCITADECPPALCGFTADATSEPQDFNFYGQPSFYNNASYCQWEFRARPGHHIQIDFAMFYTRECCDALLVVDGEEEREPMIGLYPMLSPLISFTNTIILRFISDQSRFLPDIRATFREIDEFPVLAVNSTSSTKTRASCGFKDAATERDRPISSPGWPGKYDDNLDCNWTIEASEGKRVEFRFTFFRTEGCCDYLEFIEDGRSVRKIQGLFANATSDIGVLVSTSNSVLLRFHTDGSVNERGFDATFKETDEDPNLNVRDCGFDANVTDMWQPITSPGWQAKYPHNVDCIWNLHAQNNSRIELRFDRFRTEECCDVLTIDDGGVINRYSGTVPTSRRRYVSETEEINLVFRSDQSTIDEGFLIMYREIPSPPSVEGSVEEQD